MNGYLVFGTLMGAVVLVGVLRDLVILAATVPLGRKRGLDASQQKGFALSGVVLGMLVLLLHPGPVMEKLGAAGFTAASIGLFLRDFVTWLCLKRQLGPRLISVRRPVGCLVLCVVVFGSGVLGVIDESVHPAPDNTCHLVTRISFSLFWLTALIYSFVWLGFAGLELRQHGYLTFSHRSRWSDLESYRWKGDGTGWLTLELKHRDSPVPRIIPLIPLAQKTPTDNVLRQHIADASVESDLTSAEESMPWADASTMVGRDELTVVQRAFRSLSHLAVLASDGTLLSRVKPAGLGDHLLTDKAANHKFLALKPSHAVTSCKSYQVFGAPDGRLLGSLQLKKPRSNEWEILADDDLPVGSVARDAAAHDVSYVHLSDQPIATIKRLTLFLSTRCRLEFSPGDHTLQDRSLALAAAVLLISIGQRSEFSARRVVRLLLIAFGFISCATGALFSVILLFFVLNHPEPLLLWPFGVGVALAGTGIALIMLGRRS